MTSSVQPPVSLLVVSSDEFPPRRVDVAVLFGEELAGRGHRIDWILQSEAACARAFTTPLYGGTGFIGATDTGNSLLARIHKHARGIANDLRVFGQLKRGDYDLVLVKDKFIAGVWALLAARLYRRRFVYWLSFPFPESYLIRAGDGTARYPFLYRLRGMAFWILLYRMLLPAADHIFVQSEQMRRDVAAHGIRPEKMTAVPMGVRAAGLLEAPADKVRLIPEGEHSILYLGTLTRMRRLDFLVRVLARVRRSIPDAKLYVVGRGDEPEDEQLLLEEARREGISDALVLVGQLPQPQALRYVSEAGVCVSPFYPTPILNSASPTKLVEYMALGKAVVANDHPEQRLVIEESGGGYCVPWDEDAFADAIVRLMQSPQSARAMGERGREYVRQHRSYAAIADSVEQALAQVARAPALT